MSQAIDITGQRFHRLTVLSLHPERSQEGTLQWLCRCDCGNERIVRGTALRRGNSRSCGCYAADQRHTGHRLSDTPEYHCWRNMRERCLNPTNVAYRHYGQRGITVCADWNLFERFLSDMGRRPSPTHSLDRIDNDGDYTPSNCRWATREEQRRNMRTPLVYPNLTVNGETLSLTAWAKRLGSSREVIRERLKLGWPVHLAVTTPVRPHAR